MTCNYPRFRRFAPLGVCARNAPRFGSRLQTRERRPDPARSPSHCGLATAQARSFPDTTRRRWPMCGSFPPPALRIVQGRWSPPWPVLKTSRFPRWSRWSPAWPVLARAFFSSRLVALPQSRRPSDSRPPSPDGPRFPARSAAATNPAAPAQSPAAASFCSRHCPCQPRLPAPRSKLLSWASNMAGFEV